MRSRAFPASAGCLSSEDAAQSLGGTYQGQAHGSFGDFSIFSFGGTKIISAGGEGALLFDDDEYLGPITRELERLPRFVYRHSSR